MMNWYKQSEIQLGKHLSYLIKERLKAHPFFLRLLQEYKIPVQDIEDHLRIEFVDLDDKFAEGNGEEIRLDKSLLKSDFLSRYFHFVAHEFFHWIKRRKEALFYFNDDEEVQSFVIAIAWEVISGTSPQEIFHRIMPIVKAHFKDKASAEDIYRDMFNKATILVKKWGS